MNYLKLGKNVDFSIKAEPLIILFRANSGYQLFHKSFFFMTFTKRG